MVATGSSTGRTATMAPLEVPQAVEISAQMMKPTSGRKPALRPSSVTSQVRPWINTALAQLLGEDAGQQEREDNDAQGIVLQARDHRLLKFLLVLGKQEGCAYTGEARHAEQDQRDLLQGCNGDHQCHEHQQRQARAEGAAIELHLLLIFHFSSSPFFGDSRRKRWRIMVSGRFVHILFI